MRWSNSVGHNRGRHGTKYANSTGVGDNRPTKTINASDCMCSYIDGSIKISARTRFGGGVRDGERHDRSSLFTRIRSPPNSQEKFPSPYRFSRIFPIISNIKIPASS